MKRLMFVVAALASAALVFVGCGGSDDDAGDTESLSLQAYFDEVSALLDVYEADNEDIFNVLNTSNDVDELKTAFANLPANLDDFLTGFEALGTPAEAEDAAQDVTTAGENLLAGIEEANEEAQAATTVDEFVAAADTTDLQSLSEAFNATCPPMQDVASTNGVEIDLGCPQ